jgi:hypothetical protein
MYADFGGQTGTQAQQAFEKVAAKADERSQQMTRAAEALGSARGAMVSARATQSSLGPMPSEPTAPTSQPGVQDAEDLKREQAYHRQKSSYNAALADREARSEAAANEVDRVFEESTRAMKQVHGEPDPRPKGDEPDGQEPTVGGGGGGATAPTAATPSAGSGGASIGGAGGGGGGGGEATASPVTPTDPTSPTSTVVPIGASDPGSAQGGSPVLTPSSGAASTPVGGSTTSSGGIGAPAAGGLAAALGGGLMGGAAGIGGAVRGGGVTAAPATGARGQGGRPIGSSARAAGASGALGRGAVAGSAGSPSTRPTSATGSRSAGGAGGAARAAGSGARGSGVGAAGQAGSRSGSGARATGAGATGAAGRKQDREKRRKDEFFEDVQDWVDDEGAAPGVID